MIPAHVVVGKIIKKCCLAKTSLVTDLTWQKMRQAEGTLALVLLEYAVERFREGILTEAWNEFYNEEDIELSEDKLPLEFETIFLPWLLFNWIDDGYFEKSQVDFVEKPIASLYLKKNIL